MRPRPRRRAPRARPRVAPEDGRPDPSVVAPPPEQQTQREPDAESDAERLPRVVAHVAGDAVHHVVELGLADLVAHRAGARLHAVRDLAGLFLHLADFVLHAAAERLAGGFDLVFDGPGRGVYFAGHGDLLDV